MKKAVSNYLVIAVLTISAAFTSCSGSGGSSGKIKMTTEETTSQFVLGGSGVATVDWGDGSEKVMLTLNENGVPFEHTYPNASIRTITISGDNISAFAYEHHHFLKSLDVRRCTELTFLQCKVLSTSLDVSKNTALKALWCFGEFTSFDVSKNTVLTYLFCGGQLSSAALNTLFGTLHGNAGEKFISIDENPGASECDRNIAQRKGWTFQ